MSFHPNGPTVRRQPPSHSANPPGTDAPGLDTLPFWHAALTAIVGESAAMRDVLSAIRRFGATDLPVLIRGETGTGKELAARAVHACSRSAGGPLVSVNCAAIPEALWESEFFGHERGAFTGADERRIGRIEQAAGGTLFLDEIGDMPRAAQAKLLRALDGNGFYRVGGSSLLHSKVRVVSATSYALDADVQRGNFRLDLYHRLNVVAVNLPPLRERLDDLPLLAEHLLKRYVAAEAPELPAINNEAFELLSRHRWPGNVRELENCIQRMLIFSTGAVLGAADARRALALWSPTAAPDVGADWAAPKTTGHPLPAPALEADGGLRKYFEWRLDVTCIDGTYDRLIGIANRVILEAALGRADQNQSLAARRLGLSRQALRDKLRKHGLLSARRPRKPR